jgi:hypothetical protein
VEQVLGLVGLDTVAVAALAAWAILTDDQPNPATGAGWAGWQQLGEASGQPGQHGCRQRGARAV